MRKDISYADMELLNYISIGMTNDEIANEMKHAESTIERYRFNLLKRLGARNSAHLVRIAFEKKLLTA